MGHRTDVALGASARRWQGGSWLRRNRRVLAIGASIAAAAVVLVVVVLSAGGGSSTTTASTPARSTAPPTTGAAWLDGAAGTKLNAVNSAVVALTAARHAGGQATIAAAGRQLVVDAHRALDGTPPPVDRAAYATALNTLIRAGEAAESGRVAAVGPLVDAGISGVTAVTAAVNAPSSTHTGKR